MSRLLSPQPTAEYPLKVADGTWTGPDTFEDTDPKTGKPRIWYTARGAAEKFGIPQTSLERWAGIGPESARKPCRLLDGRTAEERDAGRPRRPRPIHAQRVAHPYRHKEKNPVVLLGADLETIRDGRQHSRAEWVPAEGGNGFEPGEHVEDPWTDEEGITWVTDAWVMKHKGVSDYWLYWYRSHESILPRGGKALRSRKCLRAAGKGPNEKTWNRLGDVEACLAGKEMEYPRMGKGPAGRRRRQALSQAEAADGAAVVQGGAESRTTARDARNGEAREPLPHDRYPVESYQPPDQVYRVQVVGPPEAPSPGGGGQGRPSRPLKDVEQKVCDLLRKGQLKADAIAKGLKYSAGYMRQVLADMVRDGFLDNNDNGYLVLG
jgi:hypothetical protein